MMCGLTAVIQAFQQSDLLTVAVVVIRGFQIKGQVTQNRMVNHALKGLQSQRAFSNIGMTVLMAAQGIQAVVQMHGFQPAQSDNMVKFLQHLSKRPAISYPPSLTWQVSRQIPSFSWSSTPSIILRSS